jgi:curved DNA-binding protein CbpA
MKPSETENLYERLEINSNASPEEIKKAYRKQSMKYHPDHNNGNNEDFRALNEAYETLSNSEKKKGYDMVRSFYKPLDLDFHKNLKKDLSDWIKAMYKMKI